MTMMTIKTMNSMRSRMRHIRFARLLVALALFSSANVTAASTEKIIHNFNAYGNGALPQASLVADAGGNLYGTAPYGGSMNYGVVFMLTPTAKGPWTETILHAFQGGTDGSQPMSGLVFDKAGNLYGTTYYGTVFELSPGANGAWTEKILHAFQGPNDGAGPQGNLIFDSAGNLYGTTQYGGGIQCSCGTVFKLSPTKQGGWKETILYSFTGHGDGSYPIAGVILDNAGNLYGTTYGYTTTGAFCAKYCGTAFKLAPSSTGQWTETTLHTFTGYNDGQSPAGGLILDSAGNLYGTTRYWQTVSGGFQPYGTVFELTPSSGGNWSEKILSTTIFNSLSSLVSDSYGNLYGTGSSSPDCGSVGDCGLVFELSPNANGDWSTRWRYSFTGNLDGWDPVGGLILDAAGNLYGTTAAGGGSGCTIFGIGIYPGCGTVFKVTPSPTGGWKETQLYNFPGNDGSYPYGLTADPAGGFYVSDDGGGAYDYGAVTKLTQSNGAWVSTLLYSFTGGKDGNSPNAVTPDAAGNLFGSTQTGGTYTWGCGVVFELAPEQGGTWKNTVLREFAPGPALPDGCSPDGNVVLDTAGSVYGTTTGGGGGLSCKKGCGVVFKLSPGGSGPWNETVLHKFGSSATDGQFPGDLTFDAAGNLFGITGGGGSNCSTNGFCGGTAFELSPASNGEWKYNIIYNFPIKAGSSYAPGGAGPLILDGAGNLYGISQGGTSNCGTVFELSPSSGTWTLKTLYSFTGNADGCGLTAGLTIDANGNLYGSTLDGGFYPAPQGYGTAFELSPSAGAWSLTVLYTFSESDGIYSAAPLVRDAAGNLYGAEIFGGNLGQGEVFEIVP